MRPCLLFVYEPFDKGDFSYTKKIIFCSQMHIAYTSPLKSKCKFMALDL